VDTIERALLEGEVDLAVHSAKDVPGDLAPGTEIVAVPPREDPVDLLIGDVPEGARVGTASLRRRAQLLAWRDDLDVAELRGNVDTRLRKWRDGEVQALVLAAAGLRRLGRGSEGGVALDAPVFVPAPGQGALAVQARADDDRAHRAASAIGDAAALACLIAERDAVRVLEASCHTPVGVFADGRTVRGFVGRPDGSAWVLDEVEGLDGEGLARRMLAAGAREILAA